MDNGKSLDIEAPFVRYVKIKQASADGSDRRPVVRLTMQLGSLTEKAEFSLKDRSDMDFSLLLGREFIKDVAVVDVAREFVQPKPDVALLISSKKAAAAAAAADKQKADSKKAPAKKSTAKKTDSKKAKAEPKPASKTATEVNQSEAAGSSAAAPTDAAKETTPSKDKQ